MTRLYRWIGGGLVFLAVAVFTAIVLHPISLGGFARGGKVEDGRYFVVSKGHVYTEVSEARWRIERDLECSFPWLPVVLLWIGLAFRVTPDVPKEPAPPPLTEPLNLTVFVGVVGVVGVVGTAAGVVVGWDVTGGPWTTALAAWVALWGSSLLLAWLLARFSRQPSSAEQGAGSGPAGVTAFRGS